MTEEKYLLEPNTNFAGFDFKGQSLTELDLNNCSFESSNVDGVTFSGVNLAGANFQHCSIANCTFDDCIIDGANFSRAQLGNTYFNDSSLQRTNFSFVYGDIDVEDDEVAEHLAMNPNLPPFGNGFGGGGCGFYGVDLSGSILWGARLSGADFGGATLDDACFTEAQLIQTKFIVCNMERTRFDRTYFTHSVIEDSTGLSIDFSGARLGSTHFNNCLFPLSRFVRATLAGAVFSSTELFRADFRCADGEGISGFDYCEYFEIDDVDLITAGIREADFEWAAIPRSSFQLEI